MVITLEGITSLTEEIADNEGSPRSDSLTKLCIKSGGLRLQEACRIHLQRIKLLIRRVSPSSSSRNSIPLLACRGLDRPLAPILTSTKQLEQLGTPPVEPPAGARCEQHGRYYVRHWECVPSVVLGITNKLTETRRSQAAWRA